MSTPAHIPIGTRVRVRDDVPIHTPELAGAEGEVQTEQDQFGRYGVRLQKHPRRRLHWLYWFRADVLAVLSNSDGSRTKGTEE